MKNRVQLLCIAVSLALTNAFDFRLLHMGWHINSGLIELQIESYPDAPWLSVCSDSKEAIEGRIANLMCRTLTKYEIAEGSVGRGYRDPTEYKFDSVSVSCHDSATDISECDLQLVNCSQKRPLTMQCTVPGVDVELNITAPQSCEDPNYFRCKSKTCIYKGKRCDGIKDCDSGEDEEHCIDYMQQFEKIENRRPTTSPQQTWRNISITGCATKCAQSRNFTCASFAFRSQQLSSASTCLLYNLNQELGILLRSDPDYLYYDRNVELKETACNFTCFNSKCISCNECVCNGIKDCSDGSDERYCQENLFNSPCPSIEKCTLLCTGGLQMDDRHCRMCICKEVEIAANRFDVRIVDGVAPYRGRVEVHMNGIWGVICKRYWPYNIRAADVVCKEAGFHKGRAEAHSFQANHDNYGVGNGKFLMADISCHGNESSIAECDFNKGDSNCSLQNAAVIYCSTDGGIGCGTHKFRCDKHACIYNDQVCDGNTDCIDETDELYCNSSVRLTNGPNKLSGRVEILHDGRWNRVCEFYQSFVQVVCRSLGYHGEAKGIGHGDNSGPMLQATFYCFGQERSINECEKNEFLGGDYCKASTLGVICKEGKELTNIPPPVKDILPISCGNSTVINPDNLTSGELAPDSAYKAFPWIVKISAEIRNDDQSVCDGAIISEFFVITSARCFWLLREEHVSRYLIKPKNIYKIYEVSRVIVHEDYHGDGSFESDIRSNDIALLKIKSSYTGRGFPFHSRVGPVCLPSPNTTYAPGTKCVAAGWKMKKFDSVYSSVLDKIELPLESHGSSWHYCISKKAWTFCASNSSEYDIDVGGPLACENSDGFVLYGIAQFYYKGTTYSGQPEQPTVFTNVKHFLGWIYDKLEEDAAMGQN